MSFKGLQNPTSVQKSLELARLNREALGEPQMTAYRSGVPERFAGERIAKSVGPQGDFAADADNPQNRSHFANLTGRLQAFSATFENPGGMA